MQNIISYFMDIYSLFITEIGVSQLWWCDDDAVLAIFTKKAAQTWIFWMMSATLTAGSWAMVSLLWAFIFAFIQAKASFTLFSTTLISSALKCW